VLPQIAHLGVDQVACRLRQHNLPTVSGGTDPRSSVHVQPDVALVDDVRFAGVEAHANTDWAAQRSLSFLGSSEGIVRLRENDEEGVPLRVHFDAGVARERLAQHTAVLGERLDVVVAELVQQPRRALDVGEEKRDGATRKLPHGQMIRQQGGSA
jgi:hypothetical protein